MPSLRDTNRAIAAQYERLLYDPAPSPVLEPERMMGLAALYGGAGRIGDILDIGCGTGTELSRMAALSDGRVVGFDLSAAPLAMARERCAPFGARVDLRQADILDVDPAALGQFDLIILMGVINFVPPQVRERLLELVGACMRPGGVAVISYYAGTAPTLRANLHRMLRAAHEPGAPPREEVARARDLLRSLARRVPAGQKGRDLLIEVIDQTLAQEDVVFFHEVLNHDCVAQHTTTLERAMAPSGVQFLTYLEDRSAARAAESLSRAFSADTLDYMAGSYRYALFGKPSREGLPDVRDPRVTWRTDLRPVGPQDEASEGFILPARNAHFDLHHPVLAAFVDALVASPKAWDAAARIALRRRVKGADRTEEEQRLAADVLHLMCLNAVSPFIPLGV